MGGMELGLRYSLWISTAAAFKVEWKRISLVGLNAYLSANIRLMFNYVRAHVKDLAEPGGDDGRLNIFQGRFQIAFLTAGNGRANQPDSHTDPNTDPNPD